MNSAPVEELELRALEQRNLLHKSADELRAKAKEAREKLRFCQQARQHFWTASAAVSVIGLGLGYAVGGMFTRR
jgi:hypothetical protein